MDSIPDPIHYSPSAESITSTDRSGHSAARGERTQISTSRQPRLTESPLPCRFPSLCQQLKNTDDLPNSEAPIKLLSNPEHSTEFRLQQRIHRGIFVLHSFVLVRIDACKI